MKKSKKQNIVILGVGIIIISGIIVYNFSAEQTRQKGFKFGNDLLQIQDNVKALQVKFNSEITQYKEEDLTISELSKYSEKHIEKMQEMILKYNSLMPPKQFAPSVELFKLSTQAELDSDMEFIKWLETGDKSHSVRSDALLQESFQYEMSALGEFNAAKVGLR